MDTSPCPLGPASRIPHFFASSTNCFSKFSPAESVSLNPPDTTKAVSIPICESWGRVSIIFSGEIQIIAKLAFPFGISEISAWVCIPRISGFLGFVAKMGPLNSALIILCSATKPNFPGCVEAPTTTTPLGLNRVSILPISFMTL